MATRTVARPKGTQHGLRQGPPGDTAEYWMPRDIAAWEKAWDAFRGTHVAGDAYKSPSGGTGEGEHDPIRAARHAEAMAFIKQYDGNFGLILDFRAKREWGTKFFRLSDRQIDAVLNSKARDLAWAAARAEQVASVAARDVKPTEPVTHGMYRLTEKRGSYETGSIFKVQKAVHGSGNLYAKILVVDAPGDGHFEYAPGAIRLVTVADRMTADEAAEWGRLYGMCIVCSATLTDEKSIAAGIGPICAGRV